MKPWEIKSKLKNIDIEYIYSCTEAEKEQYIKRLEKAIDGFSETFSESCDIRIFSAPGRTEIGGNHTDHQRGAALGGGLNLDIVGVCRPNGTNTVNIKSEGYDLDTVDLSELDAKKDEYGKSRALVRGVAAGVSKLGYTVGGFDAYLTSSVLKGSGMSSSAAYEVLIANMMNGLFADGKIDAVTIAKIGQRAENTYFGKPCGLLDQMASSVSGMVFMDFKNAENPEVEKIEFDFSKTNHALCIIDTGADHADLTDEYSEITKEMKAVAGFFGKDVLSDITKAEFTAKIGEIRKSIKNDRAILRALHFFNETERAKDEAKALKNGDFDEFLKLVKESGRSSYMYLQNVYSSKNPQNQAVSLTLALCEEILGERGAYRVHGGGFAGTVQAFVPFDMLSEFKKRTEAVLGEGACRALTIRPVGGAEFKF